MISTPDDSGAAIIAISLAACSGFLVGLLVGVVL